MEDHMSRAIQSMSVIAILLATATPSRADLTFCNKTDATMSISLGYMDRQQGWMSRGWFTLEEGACRTVVPGNLEHSYYYYYYYANDTRGRSWSARREQQGGWFCISDEKHALPSRNYRDDNSNLHCEENGLKAKQFKILDIGNSSNFTLNLSAGPDQPAAQPASKSPVPAPQGGGTGTACQRFPNMC
jgi:uncharacterized membrane protein